MAAGNSAQDLAAGALPLEQIAPGGSQDREVACPEQGDIPYNNLAADAEFFGQGGGADGFGLLAKLADNGFSALFCVHVWLLSLYDCFFGRWESWRYQS